MNHAPHSGRAGVGTVHVGTVHVGTVHVGTVHVIVPAGICDPSRPSGGNVYDRRICQGLTDLGWSVRVLPVAGDWPSPDGPAFASLARIVAAIPDGGIALLDGLIASTAPQVLVPQAARIRVVVLVHLPLGTAATIDETPGASAGEAAVLMAAAAVVTTSAWTRDRLVDSYALPAERVTVARPGVDRAELAAATVTGARLLCVAAVTPVKGHDVLVEALATITDLGWHCDWVGPVDRDPAFVDRVGRQVTAGGLADRLRLTGPLSGNELDNVYAASDLLVVASRVETYGMVVTEALARGIPVLATKVGGLQEALGAVGDGSVPGLLVQPGDPVALAAALRRWLGDAELRRFLRRAAGERRGRLRSWTATSAGISAVLAGVAA